MPGGERRPGLGTGLPIVGADSEALRKYADSKSAACPFRGGALALVRIGHRLCDCALAPTIMFPLDTGDSASKGRYQKTRILGEIIWSQPCRAAVFDLATITHTPTIFARLAID